jgi:hypothetical protein
MEDKVKCTACPECGDKETKWDNELGDGYRVCAACKQEWWTDIDYTVPDSNIK